MKVCKKCNKNKSLSEFSTDKWKDDAHRTMCKNCDRLRTQKYRKDNLGAVRAQDRLRSKTQKHRAVRRARYWRDPERFRIETRAHLYGIPKELMKKLAKETNCRICAEKINLYVDHCHISGEIRGMICSHCNFGLGHFKDDPNLLKKAINYLRPQDE